MIFTNHHCGYGVIAGSSTVEHNYLKDGFYAYSKDQEIKSDLTVTFLERIVDVTDQVESGLKGLDYAERAKKTADVYKQITDKVADSVNSISGKIYSMFKGNQYIMYVYKIYKDIRLVGVPPESIGKFGGDTDNWEWPRHTCDYSIFRVYTTKDGKPATYSADNVPMKPKWFLPVSLKGYKDGDYSMIYGYPGGTNRYETSFGIKLKNEIENPSLVHLRDVRLKDMHEEMIKDPAVKLKLAENYATVANYWKFYDGETKHLEKYHVYEAKQNAESKFGEWAKNKPEYQNVLSDYAKNYDAWTPYAKERVYLYEGILGSPLIAYASSLISVERALTQQGKTQADVKNALAVRRPPAGGRQRLDELDEGALISILTEPKNALTKQYRRLFEMEGAELEFRDEALRAVAHRAMQRKTGARGLRTILETVLLDTMYELPSMRNVSKVVVDETVIEGQTKPYVVYGADDGRLASVDEPRRASGTNHH